MFCLAACGNAQAGLPTWWPLPGASRGTAPSYPQLESQNNGNIPEQHRYSHHGSPTQWGFEKV